MTGPSLLGELVESGDEVNQSFPELGGVQRVEREEDKAHEEAKVNGMWREELLVVLLTG